MATLYLRNLLNPDSIKIRRSISGGREMQETVRLILDNSDGYYSGLVDSGEDLRGKRVQIVRGDENDTPQLRYMLYPAVNDYEITTTEARFDLRVFDPDAWQSSFHKLKYDYLAAP